MKRIFSLTPMAVVASAVLGGGGCGVGAPHRYTPAGPEWVWFAEFRGYEQWENVAVSATGTSLKSIQANPVMMGAYKAGVPGNGQVFPDGSKIVKIEWLKQKNPRSPYFVEVPQTLKSISFIEKDTQRFPA